LAQALGMSPTAALRLQLDTLSLSKIDHITQEGRADSWTVKGVNI